MANINEEPYLGWSYCDISLPYYNVYDPLIIYYHTIKLVKLLFDTLGFSNKNYKIGSN